MRVWIIIRVYREALSSAVVRPATRVSSPTAIACAALRETRLETTTVSGIL
jgi:hypothetical protein